MLGKPEQIRLGLGKVFLCFRFSDKLTLGIGNVTEYHGGTS
jgi:hypothetical protein